MAKPITTTGTTQLNLSLSTPGMSPVHRAGLGGLACSLDYIEREHRAGRLHEDEVPGSPWQNDKPPWEITPIAIILDFREPDAAGEFLQRLFALAFRIGHDDGLIRLPGQYRETPPDPPTLAALQAGMTLTFLQHGKSRTLAKTPSTVNYSPEGDDGKTIPVSFAKCSWYAHQDGWKNLVDARSGRLITKSVDVAGPMNPGAVVRHTAYTGPTKISEPVELALPLYFALVGCLSLRITTRVGALLIPEVNDLEQFIFARPFITPKNHKDACPNGLGDAALQMQLRLRAARTVDDDIPSCAVVQFQPMPWATQQKLRSGTMTVNRMDEQTCEQFQTALAELPTRIASKKVKEKVGKGKAAKTVERTESFLAPSVLRPFVADNLAQGRRWYEGFAELMTQMDSSGKKPLRDKIVFEKKGLHAMSEKIPWNEPGEAAVVRAVHQALKMRFGMIAEENKGADQARKKRMQNEYERWRLAFSGAKTSGQFRQSLCDLFSRARINKVLQEHWPDVLPMLQDNRWELTRDLALLGLASYKGTGKKDLAESDVPEEESDE